MSEANLISAVLIPLSSCSKMPWKNGQGVTSEIAVEPTNGSLVEQNFLWRLSAAEISADAPFSAFPGYHRMIALLKGQGLDFLFEGNERKVRLERGKVLGFSGTQAVKANLTDGPVTDLNLIYAQSRVQASFDAVLLKSKPRSFALNGGVGFVVCAKGGCLVSVFPGEFKFKMQVGDVLRMDLSAGAESVEGMLLIEPQELRAETELYLIDLTV